MTSSSASVLTKYHISLGTSRGQKPKRWDILLLESKRKRLPFKIWVTKVKDYDCPRNTHFKWKFQRNFHKEYHNSKGIEKIRAAWCKENKMAYFLSLEAHFRAVCSLLMGSVITLIVHFALCGRTQNLDVPPWSCWHLALGTVPLRVPQGMSDD